MFVIFDVCLLFITLTGYLVDADSVCFNIRSRGLLLLKYCLAICFGLVGYVAYVFVVLLIVLMSRLFACNLCVFTC